MKALRLRAFPSAFPGTASETPKLIPGWGWRCSALRPARNTGGLRPHWGNWERWSPPGLSGGSARRFGFRRCPLRPWGMWGRSVGSRCLCKSFWGPAVLPYGLSGFVAEVWARGSALFCFELRFPPLFSVPESLLPSFPGSSARRWGAGGLWGLQLHPRNELHSKSFSRGSGTALGWGGAHLWQQLPELWVKPPGVGTAVVLQSPLGSPGCLQSTCWRSEAPALSLAKSSRVLDLRRRCFVWISPAVSRWCGLNSGERTAA